MFDEKDFSADENMTGIFAGQIINNYCDRSHATFGVERLDNNNTNRS